MLPRPSAEHYRSQQVRIAKTITLVRREWARMGEDFDGSWAMVGPRVALATAYAQLGSAQAGAAYVPATLDSLGQSVRPEVELNPRALAGVAQSLDGVAYGSLDELLYGAVIHARTAKAQSLQERLRLGGQHLDLLVHTQVSDASKQAASVAMVARPDVGYVRMANPPCCQRCAVLAGKPSKATAFARHPRCDCIAIPTTVANPDQPLGINIRPEDIKDLTKAQRQAISDGADMNQVINAHRNGARSKSWMTTTEGATKRGVAGRRIREVNGQRRVVRLTPEGIYRTAGSRDEALQMLADNGYLL